MRVLIAGYFGYGNAGDEAILSETLSLLRSIEPSLEICVVGGDSDSLETGYGVTGIPWHDDHAVLQAIQESDKCILGGGGLINDYWGFNLEHLIKPSTGGLAAYLSIPFNAYLMGKPCMLYAAGVGPLQHLKGTERIAEVLGSCQIVSVRDQLSYEILADLFRIGGIQKNIEICIDPAFNVQPKTTQSTLEILEKINPSDKALIGVNLRYWGQSQNQEKLERSAARAFDRHLNSGNRHYVFLPFQIIDSDPFANDLMVLERVRDQMNYKEKVTLVHKVLSAGELCSLINQCSAFVGMRYHANVFAIKGGIPTLGLAYDPKVNELFRSTNQSVSPLDQGKWDTESIFNTLENLTHPGAQAGNKFNSRHVDESLEKTEHILKSFIGMPIPGNAGVRLTLDDLFHSFEEQITNIQSEAALKDQKISTLLDSNEKLVSETQNLRGQLLELSSKIDDVQKELANNELRITEVMLENETIEIELDREQAKSVEWQSIAQRLEDWYQQERKLRSSIQATMGYKWLSLLWRVGKLIIPEGSRRRRAYFRIRTHAGNLFRSLPIKRLQKSKWLLKPDSSEIQSQSSPELRSVLSHLFGYKAGEKETRPIIIQSTTPWSTTDGQRSAQFAHELASRANSVLYAHWRWDPGQDATVELLAHQLMQMPVDVFLSQQELILGGNNKRDGLILIEYPNPEFFSTLAESVGKGWLSIYDIVDDWQEFQRAGQAPWYDLDFEQYIINAADLVVAVNQKLAEKAKTLGADEVLIIPNGYRPGIESTDSSVELPRGEITLGYYGHLTSAWFDWGMISELAELKPDWMIHLIGEPDISGFPPTPENVHTYPPVRQEKLAAYGANWDVAIIPFKDIALSHAADPIKAYEYTAMRLPVVLTGCYPPIGSENWMRRAHDVEEFIAAVEALQGFHFKDETWDRFLSRSTWASRVQSLLESIEDGKQRTAWKRSLYEQMM